MRLLDKLGVRYPLIQAPMASVSTPALAAAVSNAGALGSIAVGASDAAAAARTITDVRSRTDAAFNVNVFVHEPARHDPLKELAWLESMRPLFSQYGAVPPGELKEIYRSFAHDDEMLATLVKLAPPVVSFHFGIPSREAIDALHGAGCVLFATATSLSEALAAESAGIDAVVAQGIEAGGHRGVFDPTVPDPGFETLALVETLSRSLNTPIIAAGGIMTGVGVNAALRKGASAVQLGTAFVSCHEGAADDAYLAAIRVSKENATELTRAISGRSARSLRNLFTQWGRNKRDAEVPDYPIAYDAGKALNGAAKAKGEYGYGAHWAGTGVHLSRAMSAADLVGTLVAELEAAQASNGRAASSVAFNG